MKTLVEQFPAQLSKALEIGRSAKLKAAKNEIRNVLITGLGGSGIGGTIVAMARCEATIIKNPAAGGPLNNSHGFQEMVSSSAQPPA